MVKDIQLRISLKEEEQPDILVIKSAIKLAIDRKDITGVKILRKSIDARKPKIILLVLDQRVCMQPCAV